MGLIHRCRWGRLLQRCADGEASLSRLARVERHLADCPDCAAEMELLTGMKLVLARLCGGGSEDAAIVRLRAHAAGLGA